MEFSWVLIVAVIIGYICIYSLVDRVCKCAENCAIAKAFAAFSSINKRFVENAERMVNELREDIFDSSNDTKAAK